MIDYTIAELNNDNISSINELVDESISEGHNLGRKMRDEWKSGENTFSKKGEKSWGLFNDGRCIAVGSINIDPYLENNDGSVGRVRHVYVMNKFRGTGLSKVLMDLILEQGRKYFKIIRLGTKNPIAAHVYESYGFEKNGELNKNGSPVYILYI